MRFVNIIIPTVVIVSVLITIAAIPAVQAVEKTVKTIGGLTNITVAKALDNQYRIRDIAKLHNASDQRTNEINDIVIILQCADNLLSSPDQYELVKSNLQSCDDSMTTIVTNQPTISNQTMLNMAKEYLRDRGIQ